MGQQFRSVAYRISPLLLPLALAVVVDASIGDRLPDFRHCVSVCEKPASWKHADTLQVCIDENCKNGNSHVRKSTTVPSEDSASLNLSRFSPPPPPLGMDLLIQL